MKSCCPVPVPSGVVTETSTLFAPPNGGVTAVMVVSLTTTTLLATAPPNVTTVAPRKFVPPIVTLVPPLVGPLFGVTEVTVGRGTLDPIGVLARGQTVEIRGTALRTGELCALQMFYADKPAKIIRDIVPDEKKRCVFTVPIPDRPGVVGEGKAKLILTKATSGTKSGEARQVFSVS